MSLPKHVEDLLKLQFEVIGVKYNPDIFKEDKWYTKHTWTKEQHAEFTDKAIAYLKKHKRMSQRSAEEQLMWWNLSYGWKDDVT